MPRPTRIEYEGAHYHVMNRGRGRQLIFHADNYYETFLETLAEACERFGLIVYGYCLMGNHYHLLVQTPQSNLGRVMRHINGVYTQRYNRLKRTDGPLFRGRYKAILVDKDNYLLQLSRYIHRNPVEIKQPLVQKLEDHRWSSYPAYINKTNAPGWLDRDMLYHMLGKRQKYQGYRAFVELGVDEEIQQFYNRNHLAAVIGDKLFIERLTQDKLLGLEEKALVKNILPKTLTIERIVQCVAWYYDINPEEITRVRKGPEKGLQARKITMYLCQQLGSYSLIDIMVNFGLRNIGSVSFITSQIRNDIRKDHGFDKQIQQIKAYIIKQAT